MGYSWVFLGTAELPPGAREAWLDGPTDPALSRARLDGPTLRELGLEESAVTPTVRELLDALGGEDVVSIDVDGPVTLRLLADKSGDAWLTWRASLVAAFVALAAHGGRGQLVVVGFDDGPDEGFQLDVGDDARLRRLTASEVEGVRRTDAYREVVELADAFHAPLLAEPPPAEPSAPTPGSYLDVAMRTVTERVLFDARDGLRRLERRMLWALFEEGAHARPVAAETVAARVASAHPGTDPAVVLAALAGLANRRGSTVSLVDIDEPARYRLTPLAAEALAAVSPDDLHRVSDRDAPEPRALPLAIPWLLAAGGQAIGVGLTCDIAPTEPTSLLAATRDRLTARAPASLPRANRAAVLVDGRATELDAIELLDAFLAERRRWLRARGVADVDARIEADLTRWLGP